MEQIKVIKKLSDGLYGSTYIVTKNNKKILMRTRKVLLEELEKSYKSEIWRDLDIYQYINSLSKNESCFFTRLIDYNIKGECQSNKEKLSFMFNNQEKKLSKIHNSKLCINMFLEYTGNITLLSEFMIKQKKYTKKLQSLMIQFINIFMILEKGGYSPGLTYFSNFIVKKTTKKTFVCNKKRYSYHGYQLSLLNTELILHKKFKIKKDNSFDSYRYQSIIKDSKLVTFYKIFSGIESIIFNYEKLIYDCIKKKQKLPWEKDKFREFTYFTNFYKNNPDLWEKIKNQIIKNFSEYKNIDTIISIFEKNKKYDYVEIIEYLYKKYKISRYLSDLVIRILDNKIESYIDMRYRKKNNPWCSFVEPLLSNDNIKKFSNVKNYKKLLQFITEL